MVEEKDKNEKKSGSDNNDSGTKDIDIKFDFLEEENEIKGEEEQTSSEEQYDKDELLPILIQQEEIENLKKQLEEVSRERDDLYDRLLRKLADFNNFRKRIEKEKQDFYKYASANLVKELLPVLDNFEKALASSKDNNSQFYKGVELIYKQLIDILKKEGVEGIKAKGEQFDPAYHEAIGTAEEEDIENNVIIEEYQKGYIMHDKLLRPALVRVNVRKEAHKNIEKEDKEVGDNEESNRN